MEGLQRGWCLIMLHHHLRQKVKQIVEGPHHSYYLTLLCLFGGKFCFSLDIQEQKHGICQNLKTLFTSSNFVLKAFCLYVTKFALKGQQYLYSSCPKIVEASDENEFPIVCQWPWKEATLCRYLPRILRMIDFT